MKPYQYAFLFALIGAIIGLLFNPALLIVGGVVGFIIGIPLGMKINERQFYSKVRQKEKRDKDMWNQAMDQLDEYLDNMEMTSNISDKMDNWEAQNRKFNARQSDTYYDVKNGSKSEIKSIILDEMRMFYRFYQKRDPECRGWQEFTSMLRSRSHSCSYRWGVNRFGHEVWRLKDDQYVIVKIRHDSYYA